MSKYFFALFTFVSCSFVNIVYSQGDFAAEVLEIQKRYDSIWDSSKSTIVFTGSSSIRMWKDLQERFPEHQIVNTGFGGSETVDLQKHIKALVIDFKPHKVFIYEGDNDINYGKTPKQILSSTQWVIDEILKNNTQAEIILISAKPSISRWHLRKKYRKFNKRLAKLSRQNPAVFYADVWNPMLENKELRKELFIEDNLHMNDLGYDIWYNVLKNYIN